jgi:leucyl-tRNA synthetase
VSDNFLDSAWYFLRYTSTEFDDRAWDADRIKQWLPVAHYMGGIEHSTLHHLYARFIWKAMFDLGHIPHEVGEEPFAQLRLHGWILRDGAKMSKTKGNVVNPDEYVNQYGADVTRGHVLFMGSYTEGGDWRDEAITGVQRFLHRVWDWVHDGASDVSDAEDERQARKVLHKAVKKVGEDIEALGFNTAIATLMETLNVMRGSKLSVATHRSIARDYLLLLAPIAPLLAEELWQRIGEPYSIHQQAWPHYDADIAADQTITLVVQINGKVRDRLEVRADISEEEAKAKALASEGAQRYIDGRTPRQVIYVRGRLVNIVISSE